MAKMIAAKEELRKRLAEADRCVRASVTPAELNRIDTAEEKINRMPQTAKLRLAAADWGALLSTEPVDQYDSACREANRALLDAAVHFVRALRGEE